MIIIVLERQNGCGWYLGFVWDKWLQGRYIGEFSVFLMFMIFLVRFYFQDVYFDCIEINFQFEKGDQDNGVVLKEYICAFMWSYIYVQIIGEENLTFLIQDCKYEFIGFCFRVLY